MFELFIFAIYFLGLWATAGALSCLGKHSPETIGDCYSGSPGLDCLSCFFWPLFWPGWVAFNLTRFLCDKRRNPDA